MNCGKHCTVEDYNRLVNYTSEYLKCLDRQDPDCLTSKLNIYLEFIADFDYQVSEKMRLKISMANKDIEKIKRIIKAEYYELEHNVLVDIKEHS